MAHESSNLSIPTIAGCCARKGAYPPVTECAVTATQDKGNTIRHHHDGAL